MSRTTVLKLNDVGDHEAMAVYANSWGGAPVAWTALADAYMPDGFSVLGAMASVKDEFWAIWKNPLAQKYDRAVMMMTFDRVYIGKENFRRAAQDIRTFLSVHRVSVAGRVNHWPAIADLLESGTDAEAIGFWHTSVSENPFEQWDDEREEYDPIPLSECWELYEALDEEGE